ncbi:MULTISPECIES: hypothetical protein [Streptomyces]|uniref:hypothetical protein n=1 Tax=Streptomyces TaxID=1883 RepID=UPI001E520D21|nr:hypothetical protein [Streptomyces canarius]
MTRRLSAPVHLDDDSARYVDRMRTGDRLDTIGLSLGIDVVALARHARAATRRRATLDHRLACPQTAVPLALLAGLRGLVNGHRSLGRVAIFGPLGACAIAWTLVRRTQARSRVMARDAFLRAEGPEQTAPTVEPEAVPHDLKRANVLPHAGGTARTKPFAGGGDKIKEVVRQPIDVGRPADAPGGAKLPMRPFDVVDLNTYGARHRETTSGLQGRRARNRLHVLGSDAHLIPELADPTRRPRAQTPPTRYRRWTAASHFGAHGTILPGGRQGPGPQGGPGPAGSGPSAPRP